MVNGFNTDVAEEFGHGVMGCEDTVRKDICMQSIKEHSR
jgi:hypothetical protein